MIMKENFELNEIEAVLEEHYDLAKKEIGDRVICNDFTTVTRLDENDFNLIDNEIQFDADIYLIVIATNQNHRYDSGFAIYYQDLIIANPKTKIQFRAYSGHVSLKQ